MSATSGARVIVPISARIRPGDHWRTTSASTIGTSALGGATLGVSVAMFPPLSVPERRGQIYIRMGVIIAIALQARQVDAMGRRLRSPRLPGVDGRWADVSVSGLGPPSPAWG